MSFSNIDGGSITVRELPNCDWIAYVHRDGRGYRMLYLQQDGALLGPAAALARAEAVLAVDATP